MNREELFENIKKKESFLCVGLDPDLEKIPRHLLDSHDSLFEFNKQIIDATIDYAVAYKPNMAFYEAMGTFGWESLQKTMEYIPEDIFTIADAKRADIGNTSNMYAKAFFDRLNFDSITVSPYMGKDSIEPFLQHENKWTIILGATSNAGSIDFQDLLVDQSSEKLYERIIRKSSKWGTADNTMYVIGATRPETLITVRSLIPDHFLLIPGVGAQGGSLQQVCKFGMTKKCGLLINSSRGIIYAGDGKDFAKQSGNAAKEMQEEMARLLSSLHYG